MASSNRELPEGHTVRYVHRRRLVAKLHEKSVVLPTGGLTIARVLGPDGVQVAEGRARCRPDENFNKALGRQIALGRALADLERRPLQGHSRWY